MIIQRQLTKRGAVNNMAKKAKQSPKPLKKIIILMVEGDTEVEFYNLVLKTIYKNVTSRNGDSYFDRFYVEKPINIKGIGRFQQDAVAQFDNKKPKYDKRFNDYKLEYHVFLCIDTDVFNFYQNPPLNKDKLKQNLYTSGADNVSYIEANKSIEDWFLCDLSGIKDYLNLKKLSPGYKKQEKGAEKLNSIFSQANRTYIKGCKADGFVNKLDIQKIMCTYKKELGSLLEVFEPGQS